MFEEPLLPRRIAATTAAAITTTTARRNTLLENSAARPRFWGGAGLGVAAWGSPPFNKLSRVDGLTPMK